MQLNSLTMGLYDCVVPLLVQNNIPVAVDTPEEEDNLVVAHTPVEEEDILEVAFVAELHWIESAHVAQD
jgi:hypothetical protein